MNWLLVALIQSSVEWFYIDMCIPSVQLLRQGSNRNAGETVVFGNQLCVLDAGRYIYTTDTNTDILAGNLKRARFSLLMGKRLFLIPRPKDFTDTWAS